MLIRSMFSAVSGLKGHQTWMDVIGNNIANLNTPGFKTGRVRFEDLVSQTLNGGSDPDAASGRAGTNPTQIGLGVTVGGVDTIDTQGPLQGTGKSSDLAIQGDGYFILNAGNRTLYTRDGSFDLGTDGKLVDPSNAMYVMGWQADVDGKVDTAAPVGQLTIPIGQQLDAKPSTLAVAQGNLDAGAADGDTYATQVTVVDSLGFEHDLTLTFTKSGNNQWDWAYTTADPDVTLSGDTGSLTFDAQGNVDPTSLSTTDLQIQYSNGADDTVIPAGGDFSGMTQLQASSDTTMVANGSTAGSLVDFTVTQSGEIVGIYSNGSSKVLGQVATATFANPGGLTKTGQNLFDVSPSSGQPVVGAPGTGGRGVIYGGYLEGSNVDLAEEFTNMIRAERGFQANSRVITTSDEVLQELVNLKR